MTTRTNEAAAGPEPLAERTIGDVETLKALSDPLRLRILEVMTAHADEAFTVKRLAASLGTTPTKLYHHVNLLLERELVNVAGQRVVSGIIETSYRVAQRSLRLDRSLLATGGEAVHETLTTIFDGARDDIERGIAAGRISTSEDAAPQTKLILARGIARLEPAAAAEFRARLAALFEEFGGDDATLGGVADDCPAYGLLVGFYPLPDPVEDATEETDR